MILLAIAKVVVVGDLFGDADVDVELDADAVSAALAYRAQAPVLDGLMKELGLDGSSLDGLAKGAAMIDAGRAQPSVKEAPKPKAKPAPKVEAPADDDGE